MNDEQNETIQTIPASSGHAFCSDIRNGTSLEIIWDNKQARLLTRSLAVCVNSHYAIIPKEPLSATECRR